MRDSEEIWETPRITLRNHREKRFMGRERDGMSGNNIVLGPEDVTQEPYICAAEMRTSTGHFWQPDGRDQNYDATRVSEITRKGYMSAPAEYMCIN